MIGNSQGHRPHDAMLEQSTAANVMECDRFCNMEVAAGNIISTQVMQQDNEEHPHIATQKDSSVRH